MKPEDVKRAADLVKQLEDRRGAGALLDRGDVRTVGIRKGDTPVGRTIEVDTWTLNTFLGDVSAKKVSDAFKALIRDEMAADIARIEAELRRMGVELPEPKPAG